MAKTNAIELSLQRERRNTVAKFAYWTLQGILIHAEGSNLPKRERDLIARRTKRLYKDILCGFEHGAEVPHG
jgi:hypothetical protein